MIRPQGLRLLSVQHVQIHQMLWPLNCQFQFATPSTTGIEKSSDPIPHGKTMATETICVAVPCSNRKEVKFKGGNTGGVDSKHLVIALTSSEAFLVQLLS